MKRKVFQCEPRNLSKEDCDRLAEESEKFRSAIEERLNRLSIITAEIWSLRVK